MEIKVGTKSLNSYFIIFVFVLMEHCFYLINTDTFRIIFLNYAMTWFLLFMAGIVLLYIRYRLNRKSVRMYFSSDVSALIVLAIISIVQCNFLIGQPLSMGFAPQRNYIFILVSYFTIRKLIALDKIDINTVVNGLLFCGVLSVIIYWLQVNLIDYVTICNFMQRGITMITTPIFTRVLSEEQYGLVSTFTSWQNVLILITTLSLYKARSI